jgi:hypothetical protein
LIGLKLTRHSSSNDYNWWHLKNLYFFCYSFILLFDYFFSKKFNIFRVKTTSTLHNRPDNEEGWSARTTILDRPRVFSIIFFFIIFFGFGLFLVFLSTNKTTNKN